MRKIILLIVFSLQIAVPVLLIVHNNRVKQQGDMVKFITEPVDPYDALRGNYLSLGFPEARDIPNYSENIIVDQKIYALLELDENGFAKIVKLVQSRPHEGLYITSKVLGWSDDSKIDIELPFDRYYINEKYAKLAEELYFESGEQAREDNYVTVSVKNGRAVLKDMYLFGVEINELLKKELHERSVADKS